MCPRTDNMQEAASRWGQRATVAREVRTGSVGGPVSDAAVALEPLPTSHGIALGSRASTYPHHRVEHCSGFSFQGKGVGVQRPRPRESQPPYFLQGHFQPPLLFSAKPIHLSVAFSAHDGEAQLGMAWALPGRVCTLSGHLRGRSDHRAASLVPSPQKH